MDFPPSVHHLGVSDNLYMAGRSIFFVKKKAQRLQVAATTSASQLLCTIPPSQITICHPTTPCRLLHALQPITTHLLPSMNQQPIDTCGYSLTPSPILCPFLMNISPPCCHWSSSGLNWWIKRFHFRILYKVLYHIFS